MRRLLFSAVLAVACTASPPPRPPPPAPQPAPPAPPIPAARDDGRLPPGVVPTRYTLDLSVDPGETSFAGRVRIGVEIQQPTRVVVLHARSIEILTAAISTRNGKHWVHAASRMAAHGKREPEELVLSSDDELGPGPAEIDLQYQAKYGDGLDGLYRVDEGGRHYAFSQFEPNDARRAFPCFDEPGFKTPFSVTITTPKQNLALSNMPEAHRRENLESGLTSYEFSTSPPLPTYLVAFAVGPLELRDGEKNPVPVRLVAAAGKSHLGALSLRAGSDILTLLSRYFDIPYPYPKLDLVAVPDFGAGAMENAGLVTFREELLLLDPDHASTDARRHMAGVIAHELSHQWFGNLVTTKWWNDLWLNEGFATWMGDKIVGEYQPSWHAELESERDKEWVMGVDALASARKIRQPVRSSSEAIEAFDGITYDKGASVLRMVEHWIGEATFQKGVHTYLTAHRFGNATADDLFAALGEASGKDVARVMSSFADQSGVPLVTLGHSCKQSKGKTSLTLEFGQREYHPIGEHAENRKRWAIPVCARWADRKGEKQSCSLLDGEKAELTLPVESCPALVVPNAGENGYYRFLLEPNELGKLAKDPRIALSERERIGLIGDAWALVKSGDLEPGAFLDICGAFSDEDSHDVWEEIVAVLDEYSRALVSEKSRAVFAARVRKLLEPVAHRLGFDPAPNESQDRRLLRKTVLRALADLGDDAPSRAEATKRANQWLVDDKSVDSDLAELVLPLAARKADAAWYEKVLARYATAKLPEQRLLALSALTGFDDEKLVVRTLELSLDPNTKVQDLRYIFRPLAQRRETSLVSYRWVLAHFDQLKRRLPSFVAGRITGVVGTLCDAQLAGEGEAFFRPRLGKIEGADKLLDQAVEASKLCAALRAAELPASERALGVVP